MRGTGNVSLFIDLVLESGHTVTLVLIHQHPRAGPGSAAALPLALQHCPDMQPPGPQELSSSASPAAPDHQLGPNCKPNATSPPPQGCGCCLILTPVRLHR